MAKAIEPIILEQEYTALRAKFQTLCNEVVRQIEHSIDNKGIKLAVPIQSRAKTVISVLEKVRSGRFSIKKSVLEFQDLAGIRIITLFRRDAVLAESIVDELFDVKKKYNLAEKLTASEFGYLSTHMICTLKSEWTNLPTMSGLKELTFEVQVRTLSQHSWAEVSKTFNYKHEENVPQPVLRSINRISALLETVDLEFERLLDERNTYIKEIGDYTVDLPDSALNIDLLTFIIKSKIPNEFYSDFDDYSDFIEDLDLLGTNSVYKLLEVIDTFLDSALKENKRVCQGLLSNNFEFEEFAVYEKDKEDIRGGIYFSGVGLIRTMIGIKLGERYHEVITRLQEEEN